MKSNLISQKLPNDDKEGLIVFFRNQIENLLHLYYGFL